MPVYYYRIEGQESVKMEACCGEAWLFAERPPRSKEPENRRPVNLTNFIAQFCR